jgi:ketosteroid isomerase-like protein
MLRMTQNIEEVAELVRQAMVTEDLPAFTELLDPNVTWGAPGSRNPSCKSRDQVVEWYRRGRDAGIRGSLQDVEIVGDRLLVSMSVRGTEQAEERGGAALRFQVLTVRSGRIAEIVGFDDKTEARSYIG